MFNEHRTHRTWVLGLSASMLAGRNSHQTIPRTRGNNPKVKRLLGCTIPYIEGGGSLSNIEIATKKILTIIDKSFVHFYSVNRSTFHQ